MKNLLLSLLLVASGAHASSYDFYIDQMTLDETAIDNREIKIPTSNRDGIFFYKNSTKLPQMITIGSGLSLVSDALTATAAEQVNADWSAASGMAQILNKPTLFSGAYADLTGKPSLFDSAYTSLTGIPSTFAPSAHTHAAADVTSGAFDDARIPSLAISKITGLQTALDAKFAAPAGTTAQYVRGDGTLATLPTGTTMSINDAPGRALVTSTAATGFQISATRNARACYEGSITTTSSIGGPAAATIFLETADTNSTTPGDWTVKAQQAYSNTITLAIVLNQVQSNNWTICRDIPAGKYVRIRTGGVSGTASASINATQQETLY